MVTLLVYKSLVLITSKFGPNVASDFSPIGLKVPKRDFSYYIFSTSNSNSFICSNKWPYLTQFINFSVSLNSSKGLFCAPKNNQFVGFQQILTKSEIFSSGRLNFTEMNDNFTVLIEKITILNENFTFVNRISWSWMKVNDIFCFVRADLIQ
jgi:hypothetical protein